MCVHFNPTRQSAWVHTHFGVELPDSATFPTDTYPGYAAPILIQSRSSGRIAAGLARFGLIPPWAKDDKISRHTYNARSETVAAKPSYRHAWQQAQFCILPVEQFAEPRYSDGRAHPWQIALVSGEPMGIACLWERWRPPQSGELVVSFSMLTVNADEHPVMQQFHKPGDEKRTPVVLAASQFKHWLAATTVQAAEMMHWRDMPALHARSSIPSGEMA